jgi:hypothetical protein
MLTGTDLYCQGNVFSLYFWADGWWPASQGGEIIINSLRLFKFWFIIGVHINILTIRISKLKRRRSAHQVCRWLYIKIYTASQTEEFRKQFICSIWRNIEPLLNVSHHHFLLVSFLFIIIHRGMWRHNSTQPPSWKIVQVTQYKKSSLFFLPRAYIGDNRRAWPPIRIFVCLILLLFVTWLLLWWVNLSVERHLAALYPSRKSRERYKRSNSQHLGRNKKRISGDAI